MRRLRIPLALLAFLMVAGCARPASAPPEPTAALFYAKNGEIFVSDPPGTPGRRLTSGPGDSRPAPSPDGTRVAYIHQTGDDEPGGELRVLDIASGQSRRLVDPAAVTPRFADEAGNVDWPRWSPTGDRVAFLKASFAGGGFLSAADADTGALTTPAQPLFADERYAWSSDGTRIVWAGGRSDVSPVDVNIWAVGAENRAVVTDANAYSVTFSGDSVLFTNGDATQNGFAAIPFALRAAGIYEVKPGGTPEQLLAGGYYSDIAALDSGALAFTEGRDDSEVTDITIRDRDGTARTVAEATRGAQGPVWSGDSVAYVGTADGKPLLVKKGDADARQVDTGVDSFAWAGGSGQTGG